MKNKQPNGQKFGPKMARALKIRCDKLEDCVVSQQKEIARLQSQISNDTLGNTLLKARHDDMLRYCQMKRPDVLKLMSTLAKRGVKATEVPLPEIKMSFVKKKRQVRPFPQVPEVQDASDASTFQYSKDPIQYSKNPIQYSKDPNQPADVQSKPAGPEGDY